METKGKRRVVSAQDTKLMVEIDGYENKRMSGWVKNDYYNKRIRFISDLQFIRIAENLFESMAFPQRAFDYRLFTNKCKNPDGTTGERESMSEADKTDQTGKKTTFVVHVQFRQNATWQGSIDWVDKGKSQRFRSTLELLMLMENALSEGNEDNIEWTK